MANRRWAELPGWARAGIVAAGVLEVGLLAAAQIDITRRPADRVRGSKLGWRVVSLINIVGPLAYFCRGRVAGPESAGPESAGAE